MAPEVLFNPELIDKEGSGISNMVFQCIQVISAILQETQPICIKMQEGISS